MHQYIAGIAVFGYIPLIYAIIYYCKDVWTYLTSQNADDIARIQWWQVIF